MTVSFVDGTEAVQDFGQKISDSFPRIDLEPPKCRLHLTTTRAHLISIELPSHGDATPGQGRPVVYLDQNHWSTIAKVLNGATDRISSALEADAARQIVDLVLHRRIILPMSSAHVSETCRWTNDDDRYWLALRIAQMSGGWLMRDPLAVRREELRAVWMRPDRSQRWNPPPVFTLEPEALFADAIISSSRPDMQGGEVGQFSTSTLAKTISNFDTLLNAESVKVGNTSDWVARLQEFTDFLASQDTSKSLQRQRTDAFFLTDTTKELVEEAAHSALTPVEVSQWIRLNSDRDFAAAPALGLFREVLHEKLVNSGTRWEPNDLNDIMFLTCASAYADYVVAERSFTAQISSGLRRLGKPANICRTLAEMVEIFETLLVT